MTQAEEIDTGWRGSPELWLQAAYDALIENGIDAVKILPLAAQLKLSRTSFYWFFDNRGSLLQALRALWEDRTTTPLIAATKEYAETRTEAMFNVISCFLREDAFDARMEHAVRSWAIQDPKMLTELQTADNRRLDALRGMLEGWGYDAQDADVRARTIYLVQIGYISMQTTEPLTERLARVANYVEVYTGQKPNDREVARFYSRFGVTL